MKEKKAILIAIVLSMLLVSSSIALASSGKKWADHAPPWDFLFNDAMLDRHHEFKVTGEMNDNGHSDLIKGFMYISYNEEGNAVPGTDRVGWEVNGIFAMARFNGMGEMYPWTVYADEVPKQRGFVHWHPLDGHTGKTVGEWYPGYFLKHTAVEYFFFEPQGRWVYPGIDLDFPNNYDTTTT